MPAIYADNYPHRIYLTFPGDNTPRQIPVPPENIVGSLQGISKKFNIIGIGEVLATGGRKLESIQWESHFPYTFDDSIEVVAENEHYPPENWRMWFSRALENETPVRISIGGTPIDYMAVVHEFSWNHTAGPAGDIWYQVHLSEARQGVIKEYNGISFANNQFEGTEFNATPDTYTVKNDQTLQDVSMMVYGTPSKWQDIYNANTQELFASRPDRDLIQRRIIAGTFSGDIWNVADPLPPGMVLKIPKVLSR